MISLKGELFLRKEYWYVIITYLAMQFSGFIGLPLFMFIGKTLGVPSGELRLTTFAYWSIFSFLLALLLTLFFMRHDMKESALTRDKASISLSTFWAICGVFLALFAQSIAITIEQWIGIQTQSANTQEILSVIDSG